MHLLLLEEITTTQCGAANEMLTDFYKLLPDLYGPLSCTMNAHCLTHIAYYGGHVGHIQPFLLRATMEVLNEWCILLGRLQTNWHFLWMSS